MRLVRAEIVVLVVLKMWQHIIPVPARIAQLPPLVVVPRLTAQIEHPIDRRAAAQQLAARIGDGPAVEAGLHLGPKPPIGARIADAV